MKRFEFKVALHILIIFLLSIGSCLLYQKTVMVQHYRLYSLFDRCRYGISTEYSSSKSPCYDD